MRRQIAAVALVMLPGAVLTSGCVAAVVPVAAAGVLGKKGLDKRGDAARRTPPARTSEQARVPEATGPEPRVERIYAGTLPPPDGMTQDGTAQDGAVPGAGAGQVGPIAPPPAPVASPSPVPAGMQYLYGSGEASAISVQAWRGVIRQVAQATQARPANSVVLASGATPDAVSFVPCGDKPLAAVFDVDETVLLNLGFQADEVATGRPYDAGRWRAWERDGARAVEAVPGAVEAVEAIRTMGVTVVFVSNRSTPGAIGTQAAIEAAGLGSVREGETLFLADPALGRQAAAGKDARRQRVAARYCVVAMAGDQLGDFSDLFNAGLTPAARRAATVAPALSRLWGAGWFVLPNSAYGTALAGGMDDVFPADKRWTPAP